MQLDDPRVIGFAAALGIGLLIGLERERRKGTGPGRAPAGIRTFALTALLGAVSVSLGGLPALLLAGAFLAGLIVLGFRKGDGDDPGLTTEVALFLTLLLGALAVDGARLASGLAVLVAMLLAMRTRLHRFATTVLSADELHDALLLGAAALVVLPLLPDRPLGPDGALNLHTLWRLVVLIMAIGTAGHIGARALGPRYGLPLAGLAAGFVSSVATIGAMGERAARDGRLLAPAVAGAMLSSVATVVQMAAVLLVVHPPTLLAMTLPLLAAGAVAVLYGAWFMRAARRATAAEVEIGRAFHPGTALALAATLGAVMAAVPALRAWLGSAGIWAGAFVAGFADTHAVGASVAALARAGTIAPADTVVPILIGLSTNSVMKLVAARVSGSRAFLLRLAPGVVLIAAAAWMGLAVSANLESALRRGADRAALDLDRVDPGRRRADARPRHEPIDGVRRPRGLGLDGAVGAVSHPAHQAERLGFPSHRRAVPDALHAPGDHEARALDHDAARAGAAARIGRHAPTSS